MGQPTADKLGLELNNDISNSAHEDAAKAILEQANQGKTVLAAWEHCNIKRVCYALATEAMCDDAWDGLHTDGQQRSDCHWWENRDSDHCDAVMELSVKDGKVTAVEHHNENFTGKEDCDSCPCTNPDDSCGPNAEDSHGLCPAKPCDSAKERFSWI